jgi:transcriptional regulator with PAS, ATPase and Fis domain
MDIKTASAEEMAKLLQQILTDTPDMITLIDAQGNFLYVNKVVPGLKEENVIGTPFYSYVPPEYVDTAKSSLKNSTTKDNTSIKIQSSCKMPYMTGIIDAFFQDKGDKFDSFTFWEIKASVAYNKEFLIFAPSFLHMINDLPHRTLI